ncbi:MAG: DUF6434 domain-containing protein [Gordonia sp. (in: high G+C Gram-positive bacteria)]
MTPEQRPALQPEMTAAEFERWYWLKDELAEFARTLGIRATGGKELLAQRISAHLDGRAFTEPAPGRRAKGARLSGPLTAGTMIPAGQNCSQTVRAWFVEQVGPSFRFDAPMREFFAASDGSTTMQDALDHWRATRDDAPKQIDAQFEYNRFTRAWHAEHPGGDAAELRAAWTAYRELPIDVRGKA